MQRLIQVHQNSLNESQRNRLCHARCEVAPACREADAFQCRVVINAARREIDVLQRESGQLCNSLQWERWYSAFCLQNQSSNVDTLMAGLPSASPPVDRKAYAMPLMDASIPSPSSNPEPLARCINPMNGHLQVTNLGTLLDVLG